MTNLPIIKRATCFGFAAALAILLAGCSSERGANEMTSYSSGESKTDTAGLFTIPQDQMSHVQIVTVQASKLTRTLRLTGAVAYNAFSTTPVITQVGGPVAKILVVPGDRVKRGQPLLEVSSPDYSLLLAAYLKARDVFRVANKNYERAQDLFAHHAIADRDLLQAESDRIQAQADLSAAEQGMKILGIPKPEDLEKSPISAQIPLLAPIGGEIVERLVSPGQVMQAGTTQAFTISDMSTVWVMANIYQGDLAYVKDGDQATITTDSYPDKFSGKISFISPALDPNTRTLQARIVVDNPGGKLKKDMYCVATVTAGTISNAIAVPDSSILRDDENQPFVYVATSSNQFGRRQVDIGQSQNGQTQILKGLSPGDKVAANGSLFLQFANSFQH
ncbi:MAG TPA: efflux RND transporter periplasmic adaptor subunit [Candidatus Sulfotelmatobacter sp.]|jgi:cobalt-zinc-cadmium efflux system membrane fusion protein|nr:efflux RND transporter periplasmic adaptor subunit [Candidatus Sulfotelmatobacter sp.]